MRFAILFLLLSVLTAGCSSAELERHARNPNDPHAEATDSDRCCAKWAGNTCVEEKIRGCSVKIEREAISHGVEFPTPATVAPTAPGYLPDGREVESEPQR